MTNRTDNFNRSPSIGLGTPSDANGGWIELGTAVFGVDTNNAYNTTNGSDDINVLESSVANVDVQFTLAVLGSDFGLVGRVTDNNNYYLAEAIVSKSIIDLLSVVANEKTIIQEVNYSFAENDVLRFRLNGSDLEVYVNDVLQAFGSDGTFTTQTQHGIFAHTDTSTRIDDFSITAINTSSSRQVYYNNKKVYFSQSALFVP